MTESVPRPESAGRRLEPKRPANFDVACEYRMADGTQGIVATKFGATYRDQNLAIQRTTYLATDQETSAEIQAYPFSEPSLLMGLVRHLAAGRDEQARLDVHQQIIDRCQQYGVEPADPAKFNQVPGTCAKPAAMRVMLAHQPEPGEILADIGQNTGARDDSERLQLVEKPGGVTFREIQSVRDNEMPEGLSEDELDDYVPPVVGYQETDLFTVADNELISFIAGLAKSNLGRVYPGDMLETINGLLPVNSEHKG